jgi:hypothetical protein
MHQSLPRTVERLLERLQPDGSLDPLEYRLAIELHALPLGLDLISFAFLHPSGEVIWATGDPSELMRTRDENNVMAAIRMGAERYPILAQFITGS